MRSDAPEPGTWCGDRYARAAAHHRSFDGWFLDQHPPRPHDAIVDAGCGSGEFTATLAGRVPDGRVVGVDPDPSMLAAAGRHAAGNLEFRRGRLQELDAVCEAGSADLVVSRAVFHWIPLADYRRCYAAAGAVLRPGGWFHAESGGAGNVARVKALLDDVAEQHGIGPAAVTFPDCGIVHELLEEAGFDIPEAGVTTEAQRRPFSRDELLAFLRTQAAVAYGLTASDDLFDRFIGAAVGRAGELRRADGTYDQTFVRLHVRCRRP